MAWNRESKRSRCCAPGRKRWGLANGSSTSVAGPISSSLTIPRPFTREELDQIAPNNPVALQESYYQVFLNSRALQAFGIEANAPDPTEFVKGSIVRDAAGKPTGVIKGDIAATRPVAAKLPKVAPDQLEASSLALVKDMNRAGPDLVRRPRLQRRCPGDLSKMEGEGPAECPGVLHRRRRGRHPGAGGPVRSADRPDEAVPG